MNILPLSPPDHETNTQACITANQTPLGKKSEEVEDISRTSMALVAVEAIRMNDPMVVLPAKGRSSRNLFIQAAAYDTVQQKTITTIK